MRIAPYQNQSGADLRDVAAIGRRGVAELYRRYHLYPYQRNKFSLVDRETGEVKAIR